MEDIYKRCLIELEKPLHEMKNIVKEIYTSFTPEEISDKIAQIVTPPNITPDIQVIYQTIEGLHEACPSHTGDWYFTGNYPTKGGNRVVLQAFVNYIEGKNERAY